jgi:hypothetical protein
VKISSISNFVKSYSAFSGDGRSGTGHSLKSAFAGSSQPADSVILSPAAQAYLGGGNALNSTYDSDSSDRGYASLRYAKHSGNVPALP